MDQQQDCPCLEGDTYYKNFEERFLGADRDLGEVTVWKCKRCGRYWLDYHVEYEHLTSAGRWFRGLITAEAAASARANSAKQTLEGLVFPRRKRVRRQGNQDSIGPAAALALPLSIHNNEEVCSGLTGNDGQVTVEGQPNRGRSRKSF